ncbi:MAG: NusG domain II-containing protein [Clostridia bacterium]|nr:NusG domain II-containing protein [Clostridia bacterium]
MRKSFTKWDISIFTAVLVLAFGLYFISTGFLGEPVYVEVEVAGKPYARYEMKRYRQPGEILIKTQYGTNTLWISDKEVRVVQADCPDKLDVKQGAIGKSGETIVCLPNKLVIKISGERDLDALSE